MIKGLRELLEKHNQTALTAEQFEEELNKILPETHIPKNVYNELNEKYKALDKQKKDSDTLLAEAKKSLADSEEFKGKYDSLIAQQKEENEKYEAQIRTMKRDFALDGALSKAGARNSKAVRALLDDSKISVADDGSLLGFNEQIEAIKKDNGFLFADASPSNPMPIFGKGSGDPAPIDDSFASRLQKAMGVRS